MSKASILIKLTVCALFIVSGSANATFFKHKKPNFCCYTDSAAGETFELGEISGFTSEQTDERDGMFTDTWNFSLANDSKVSFMLLDGWDKAGFKDVAASIGSSEFGIGEWFTTTLAAGDHSLLVAGKAWCDDYLFKAKVAPVPLPGALGFFLVAALGFFGFRKVSESK